jgi:hypothetical protein
MAVPPHDTLEHLRAQLDEKRAVIARIREYCTVMTTDRRMRVMGSILLGEIDRIEREEAERTRVTGR